MTTRTTTLERTNLAALPAFHQVGQFSGELYRFHGFSVLDSNGERVGLVDWIWTNDVTQSATGTEARRETAVRSETG